MALTKETLEELLRTAGATIEELDAALGAPAAAAPAGAAQDAAALAERHRAQLMAIYLAIPPMPAPVASAAASDIQDRAQREIERVIDGQALLATIASYVGPLIAQLLSPAVAPGALPVAGASMACGLAGALSRAGLYLTAGRSGGSCPIADVIQRAVARIATEIRGGG